MNSSGPAPGCNQGFSLVELLLVVALIGILAALAVAGFEKADRAACVSAARRNAQNIVAVYFAGVSAGSPLFAGCHSVGAAMDAVGVGDNGTGTLSNTVFRLSGITRYSGDELPYADERPGSYLDWNDGSLIYDPAGGHTH